MTFQEGDSVLDLTTEMLRLSAALDQAQANLESCTRNEAVVENEYRKARANAYLATSGTVGEREAAVDKAVSNERYEAHLAAGLSKAALESVRNHRAQLSVLQTVANAVREEISFSRTGPS